MQINLVAPLAGARIEIIHAPHRGCNSKIVAPLAVVWIEMA